MTYDEKGGVHKFTWSSLSRLQSSPESPDMSFDGGIMKISGFCVKFQD
jgi:hypothetical protein